MIPEEVVSTIEKARTWFLEAVTLLDRSESLRSLLPGSAPLRNVIHDARRVAAHPRLQKPCDGRVVCALVGASGHGKTTLISELFPGLAERGWLVTEKNDTTAQSLRIECAAGPDDRDRVTVHSWTLDQIKLLVDTPEAREQNKRDRIEVQYLDQKGAVVVDGTETSIPKSDLAQFRFPRKHELRPLPRPYVVANGELRDSSFIRALTIKELPGHLSDRPVLTVDGQAFNALQLRAVVKDVTLNDPFERVARLGGRTAEEVKGLVFVDTPGLATASCLKDEVLRHCLEQKSNRIIVELWKEDELDVIVHLVLCGEQSNFATLWKAIEVECGPDAIHDLEERLVLLVNGVNIYFNNEDLSKKFLNPEIARTQGDHFATTLVDNILQKMSPRGRVRPAKVCFADSKRIVEGGISTNSDYGTSYATFRRHMLRWVEPDGVGHQTLAELSLVDDFRANIDALCDPEDRGQGFLIRQVFDIAQTKGPALLMKKYLVRTGLLAVLGDLRQTLARYYDSDGTLSREAVVEALRGCLGFLDPDDPRAIEAFARDEVDPHLEALFTARDDQPPGDGWVAASFFRMAEWVFQGILRRSKAEAGVAEAFRAYYRDLVETWAERWGYAAASLSRPSPRSPSAGDLVKHCLKFHSREIVYQLGAEALTGGGAALHQDDSDRDLMRRALMLLGQAADQADRCRPRQKVRD